MQVGKKGLVGESHIPKYVSLWIRPVEASRSLMVYVAIEYKGH